MQFYHKLTRSHIGAVGRMRVALCEYPEAFWGYPGRDTLPSVRIEHPHTVFRIPIDLACLLFSNAQVAAEF